MSKKYPISVVAQNEIERFKLEIERLEKEGADEDAFKRFRLNNGIYGIRGKDDEHMIRIKFPFGFITADQLDATADLAVKYTPTQLSHITTRQAIQLHNIKRHEVPNLLTELHEAGMTSREACGNTVRNITCDELAGVHKDEVFDVVPYADLAFRFFLRNPISQNLPRKFKIAFESTPDSDRARVGIHDLGFRAVIKDIDGKATKGFIVTVGGGLGSMPFAAYSLNEFIPVEDMLPTIEAVIRLFDRHGNRRDKNRARLKFVIKEWGIEEFRKRFEAERWVVKATSSGTYQNYKLEWPEETAPEKGIEPQGEAPGFEEWAATNVIAQKHEGYSAAYVRCLYGDMTPKEAKALAAIARDFGGGRMRTTITQNMVLRWLPNNALKAVHARLVEAGLAERNAERIADITRCPGADTCNLAVTHSKGLARALTEEVFQNGFADDPELAHITIKISGCINSCGQHHIGNIGFYGGSRTIEGKQLPHYQMLLGGRTGLSHEATQFGQRIAMIPARRLSDAVKHLLGMYKESKNEGEVFVEWVDRQGKEVLIEAMKPFQDVEALKADPSKMYEDLGDEGSQFAVKVGKGECAA